MDVQPSAPSPSRTLVLANMNKKNNTTASPEDRVRTPGLLRMPMELIEMISRFLPDSALFRFRLANRQLKNMSFAILETRFFRNHSVRLDLEGLQRLIDVANHPILGPKVKELQIRSPAGSRSLLKSLEEKGPTWARNITEDDQEQVARITNRLEQLRERIADRVDGERFVKDSGLASSLLTRAMISLKNLEVVTHAVEEDEDQQRDLRRLWFHEWLPPLRSKYDFKPESEDCLSVDDCRMIDDFNEVFGHLHQYPWDVDDRDVDSIISAMIAGGTFLTRLTVENGLFFVKKSSPKAGGPEFLLLHNCFKRLETLKLCFAIKPESDPKHLLWFLAAVSNTVQKLDLSYHSHEESIEEDEARGIARVTNEILLGSNFQSLKWMNIEIFPPSVAYLAGFIRKNNSKLKHISFYCNDCPFEIVESEKLKWSEVLRACLEAKYLIYLDFWHDSDFHCRIEPLSRQIIESALDSSPDNAGRARLEGILTKWEIMESDAGI
ncbi:hypothetical protein IWX49DRAFT_600089 [Phyllosticta citricarpa]|uniref:F-box domain-containing protein n=1 Tax=Phyllosticta citricarpa TaxID=55181 RepID=A0ABR1ME68_9PEZI